MPTINHGTVGGYYAHRRLMNEACEDCRKAINAYNRDYRARTGGGARGTERARRQALAALRENHRAEYDELIRTIQGDVL